MTYDLFTQPDYKSDPRSPFEVHRREGNPESQQYLEAGRKAFGKHLQILYDAFMEGKVINNKNSPVPEFRRRRLDLTIDNKVKISLHSTDGRMKNWHCSPSDVEYNKAKFG